jgi:hypothetical protein
MLHIIQKARIARAMERVDHYLAGIAASEVAARKFQGELIYEYSLQRVQKDALQSAGIHGLHLEANWDGSYSVPVGSEVVILPTEDAVVGFIRRGWGLPATLRGDTLEVVFPDTTPPPPRPEPHPYW